MQHATQNTPRRESAMSGTARTFAAEMLVVPSGLLVAALLSRRLSLEDYGVFTLAITFVTWLEWSLSSLFARSTVMLVSEANASQTNTTNEVAATVLRVSAATGIFAALVLAACAEWIANVLREPRLVTPLRLLALDIPLFCVSQAYRNILIALGKFGARATASAIRWIARALLIAAFVVAGLGVEGAIWGAIGASICELAFCRWKVPFAVSRSSLPARDLWQMALPLLCCALILRVFDKIDLFMLSGMGATTDVAALYGAAQNLALAPGIFTLAFAPMLLAAIARTQRAGDTTRALSQSRDALRAVFLLTPFAALVSATSPQIVVWLFGARFAPAAPVLALLLWAATALALISVCNALLLAFNKVAWALGLLLPLVFLTPLAHTFVIPIHGAIGAASVTLVLAAACALMNVFAVRKLCSVTIPTLTVLRAAVVSAMIYASASFVSGEGVWLVPQLLVFTILIGALLLILGEWQPHEKARLKALLHLKRQSG